jgi:transcriptional regulator with XRE-family HTH domain
MEEKDFYSHLIENIRRIMNDRMLKQATIAEYIGTTPSQTSKILNGSIQMSIRQLSKLAHGLSMSEIEIISYPDILIKKSDSEPEPVEAILQIRLTQDKKDQVLKLVFGENNIEILNK